MNRSYREVRLENRRSNKPSMEPSRHMPGHLRDKFFGQFIEGELAKCYEAKQADSRERVEIIYSGDGTSEDCTLEVRGISQPPEVNTGLLNLAVKIFAFGVQKAFREYIKEQGGPCSPQVEIEARFKL